MGLYAVLTGDAVAANTSKERIDLSKSDILVCASVDNKLNEKEYVFDGKEMEKPEYVACVMKNGLADKLFVSRNNMFPIWRAFKKKINNWRYMKGLRKSSLDLFYFLKNHWIVIKNK